jgi:hypothetical protein
MIGLFVGLWSRLRALRSCSRGGALVEFAFAAPALLIVIAGIIDLAMVMFVGSLIEGGVRDASRFGITGHLPGGVTREQHILDLIEHNTIGLVDVSSADISYKVYPSFGDVGQPEPYTDDNPANGAYDPGESFVDINGNGQWDADMGAAGLGGPGEIVLYTVKVDWSLLTPLMAPLMGENGVMKLAASVAVRNEPYPLPETTP